ncbi:MAG: c-type cytochrome [Hyphomicrobium sp.]
MLVLVANGGAASHVEVEAAKGKALLEHNCGRCHAVTAGTESPLAQAPNLPVVLGAWPTERLELELADGVGSRHPDMPQIQFTPEEILSIYYYLHDRSPDVPNGAQ